MINLQFLRRVFRRDMQFLEIKNKVEGQRNIRACHRVT